MVAIHRALLIYSDPLAKPFIAAISQMSLNGQRRKALYRGPVQVWGRSRRARRELLHLLDE